jgi:pimeloyl-ACP methyl ester carboxylesterase
LLISAALSAGASLLPAQEPKLPPDLKKVTVSDGVELHYVEKGKGVPVVFVHGGFADYSLWEDQLGPFAEKYRAIAYSRRYNYPNTNKLQPNYSPLVDAEDLAALIKKLDLGKVHVVGSSLGGRVALFFAVKHPELVRSLVLQELPIQFSGDPPDESREQVRKAQRAALEQGKREEVIQRILDTLSGGKAKFDKIPENIQKVLLRNFREIEASLRSDVVPEIDRDAVRKITAPTLLLSGEKSLPLWKPFEKELMRLLPEKNRQQVVISGADHLMFRTHAEQCNKAIFEFLKEK